MEKNISLKHSFYFLGNKNISIKNSFSQCSMKLIRNFIKNSLCILLLSLITPTYLPHSVFIEIILSSLISLNTIIQNYLDFSIITSNLGFPDRSVGKESTCNAGDPGSIPGLWRSIGVGIGYPLHYSWASLVAQLVKNPPAMWKT